VSPRIFRAFPFTKETSVPALAFSSNVATDTITARIRRVLKDHGRLGTDVDSLADGDDLYLAGMTSHANVNVMLALESEFDVEFPDEMLKRGTFDSIGSIGRAVASVLTGA
jgi:acyl carrier protein